MSRNSNDSGTRNRKLYAVNLPSSSEFIHGIFDAEAIETIQTLDEPTIGTTVIEITFCTPEHASLARTDTDGLQIDDGDEQKCIRLYTPDEFASLEAEYAKRKEAATGSDEKQKVAVQECDDIPSTAEPISPADSPVNGASQANQESQAVDSTESHTLDNWQSVDNWQQVDDESSTAANENNWTQAAEVPVSNGAIQGEVDEDSVAAAIMRHVEEQRINWAEVNELEEMWAICDAVSAANNGLPDSLLKEAFLKVLETHVSQHMNNWTRQHLQGLLKIWKVEVQSEKSTQRETKFCAASARYSPPPQKRRSNKGGRKKALKGLMGVGEVLESARLKFATEEGELDVDEDEYGNFMIGGQELSFEAWGALNKTSEPEIVRANVVVPPQKRRRARPAASEIPQAVDMAQKTNGNAAEKVDRPTKKRKEVEKDEGEISDESDGGKNSDSSSSSSASDESVDARRRRKKRRHAERKQGSTSSVNNMTAMFSKFYQYRFAIASSMSLHQKAAFLELLRSGAK
ncbi:spliced leader protein [Aphelenchoides avenae]|nr:spliced leader protein [Aphelenchus avenae]